MNERTKRVEMLLGEAAAEKLKRAHVAVFGVGGVGSWCAEALVRSGIGAVTLIDEDVVSESNINRQACALMSTLGMPKVEAMSARLKDISPELKIRTFFCRYEAETRDLFHISEYDYIADCIDLVSCKTDLICEAKRLEIPIVSALGAGNKLDASKFEICDISETKGCSFSRVVRRELRKLGIEHLNVVFSSETARKTKTEELPPKGRRSIPGSLVHVTATAGMLMAQEIIFGISGTDLRT